MSDNDHSYLTSYYDAISKYHLLSAEEEKELGRKIQLGDTTAREALINHNLRLVVYYAKKYSRPDNLSDMIQEGNIGLMKAVERFDPEVGFRFSTYASWWIKQACFRSMGKEKIVSIPENVQQKINRYKRTRQELEQVLGREPMAEDIAAQMGETVKVVHELYAFSFAPESLDRIITNAAGEQTQIMDMQMDDNDFIDMVEDNLAAESLVSHIKELQDNQQTVLARRFGLDNHHPHTLEEVGQVIGVSRERVRQIEIVAISRIKNRAQNASTRGIVPTDGKNNQEQRRPTTQVQEC